MRLILPSDRLAAAWLLLNLWSAAALAQEGGLRQVRGLSAEDARRIDASVERQRGQDGAVGVAIGVLRDGRIQYLRGYGYADLASQTPVGPDSLFRWASVSKVLTAVAALQLHEQGRLDLDADVRTYVPEFPDKQQKITARQLLCHQSGIVHYRNGSVVRTEREYEQEHPFADVVTALDAFKESPLLYPPGQRYSYSTHAYILLSAVVQRAGEQPFAEQVRRRISLPAGMTTLQPDFQWRSLAGRVTGYRRVFGITLPAEDSDVSWKLGGGGYLSNIEDMALLAEALLQRRLFSEETEALMWTRQHDARGVETAYGLGLLVSGQGDSLVVSHSGAQPKTRTRLHLRPPRRQGVVVATNSEWVQPAAYVKAVEEVLEEAVLAQ